MTERDQPLNPAADQNRMVLALAGLVVLGVLSWFTIDPAAVIHVHGYQSRYAVFADRDIEMRWFPLLFLGLFAFRIVLANMRARLEAKNRQKG